MEIGATERRSDGERASAYVSEAAGSERALRVLAITRIFPNAKEPLSAPFNRQQFAALAKLCDLEVMATIPWFPGSRFVRKSRTWSLRDVPKTDTIDGITVAHPRVAYVPGVAGLSGALEIASLLPAFMKRRKDVDVVLGSWAYPDGAAAVALGRMIGAPAVIKVHGSDLNVQSKMFGPRQNLNVMLPRVDRLVAVSAALGEKAISLGVPRERVAIVSNGTDAALFRVRDREEARASLTWPTHDKGGSWPRRFILYVGRVERAKGTIDLIDAFTRIASKAPDLSLVLLGDGGAMAEAKKMAEPVNQKGDRIVFLGARPLAEVPLWMGASTLVTLPSHAEGSPNVIREAMACGRPVVGTDVGGIPELVTDEVGRLCPVRDPAALGEALLDVANREFDSTKIAVRSGGSWEKSALALFDVLRAAHEERAGTAKMSRAGSIE